MNKSLGTLGIVAIASALALCDLCRKNAATSAQFDAIPVVLAASPPTGVPATAVAVQHVPLQTVRLTVKGMTCAGCVLGTRTVLKRLPGVTAADVSYEKGTAVVTYDPSKVTVAQMVAAIKTLGYTATPTPQTAGARA